MSPTNQLFSIGAWYFLPDFVTRQLLSYPASHGILSFLTKAKSQRLLYGRTFALVVLSYLLYTLFNSILYIPPNFYQVLGVTPDVDEAGLKGAFRKFAKVWHPDRRGGEGEELFAAMREVYEALKDPVKKYAYDRFGPEVLACANCASKREYIRYGIPKVLIHHAISGVIVLCVGMIGRKSPLAFWRWVLYLTLFLAEASLILSPSVTITSNATPVSPEGNPSSLMAFLTTLLPWSSKNTGPDVTILQPPTSTLSTLLKILMPSRVPYQHIAFLHQFFVFLNLALVRVVPVLLGPQGDEEGTRIEEERTIYHLTKSVDAQTRDVLRQVLSIIQASPDTPTTEPPPLTFLHDEMENMITEGTVKSGLGQEHWNAIVHKFLNETRGQPITTDVKDE